MRLRESLQDYVAQYIFYDIKLAHMEWGPLSKPLLCMLMEYYEQSALKIAKPAKED